MDHWHYHCCLGPGYTISSLLQARPLAQWMVFRISAASLLL